MSASERMTDSSRALAATLAVALLLIPAPPALSQSSLDALRQRDQEIEAIRTEQKKAAETQARLKSEIDAIGEDRRKLNQAMIDAAARLRGAEDRIGETEARLKPLDASEQRVRNRSPDAAPPSPRCWPRFSAWAAIRRPRSWCARRMHCSRFAPRSCSARWCRRCGCRPKRSPPTSPTCVRIRKEIAEREGSSRPRRRSAHRRTSANRPLGRRAAEKAGGDRKGAGGRAAEGDRAGPPGGQSQRFDRKS